MKIQRLLALSLGLICGYSFVAQAAVPTRTETRKEISRGTNNSKSGNWIKIYQDTYQYKGNIDAIKALYAQFGITLSDADLNSIIEKLANGTLTEAQLEANACKNAIADLYKQNGITLSDAELADLIKKISDGTLTFAQIQADLAKGKPIADLYKNVLGGTISSTDLANLQKKLIDGSYTWAQLTADINHMKVLLSYSGKPLSWGQWYGDFGGNSIDFDSIDKVISNRWSYSCGYGDKKVWLATYGNIKDDAAIHNITVIPNTTSCFIEISRLCQLYELMDKGLPLPSTTITGFHLGFDQEHPYTLTNVTKASLLQEAEYIFKVGCMTWSPIALDLNHDGKIGVTGKSTAANRIAKNSFVADGSVLFDLRGIGKRERFEWLNNDGDGFLVYDRGGVVSNAAKANGEIDGNKLFGNVTGYDHGYQKLALFTAGIDVASTQLAGIPVSKANRDVAKGSELNNLKVWIDANHDGYVQPSELKTLDSLGITEVGLRPSMEKNKDGETTIVSYFVQNGHRYMTEDVWFAMDPTSKAK